MAGERRALLIATDTYGDPGFTQLRAPTGDVKALAEVLGNPLIGDFQVTQLTNRTTDELKEEIEGFFDEAGRQDLLLLYISGHGVLSQSGRLYFATANTKLKRLRSTAIDDAFVHDALEHSRARSIVLMLDCCHSGAFGKGLTPKAAGHVAVGQHFEFNGRGKITVTASTGIEYAFEETGAEPGISDLGAARPGSLFTRCLVEGLTSGEADVDGDGQVSIDELYDYVYERVRERSPHQTPGKSGAGHGDIIIAWSARPAIARGQPEPEVPQPRRPARRSFPAADWSRGASVAVHIKPDRVRSRLRFEVGAGKGGLEGIAFSPDGRLIATAGRDKTARVWDARTGRQLTRIRQDDAVSAVAFSPDGRLIATVCFDRSARIWESDTGRAHGCLTQDLDFATDVAFSADGRFIATATPVCLWSVESGEEIHVIGAVGFATAVAFGDGGRLIAAACGDGAQVSETQTARVVTEVTHGGHVVAVALSPDGDLLATAGGNETARVWDAGSGKLVARAIHEPGSGQRTAAVNAVAFSPDGRLIATASDDETARVWDARSGIEHTRLTHALRGEWAALGAAKGYVRKVVFSPDGHQLATIAASDGVDTVRIWTCNAAPDTLKEP